MAGKILLVYYSQNDPPLPNQAAEITALKGVCYTSKICEPALLPDSLPDGIITHIETYPAELRIFHFAGHASGNTLDMRAYRKSADNAYHVDMRFYADRLAQSAPDLRLIFLNACATNQQAQFLLQGGIKAVLATLYPVKDSYAALFAYHFYDLFLTKGKTLREAVTGAHTNVNTLVENQLIDPDTLTLNEHLLIHDAERGNFKLGARHDPMRIYDIYCNEAERDLVENSRYTDWQAPTAASGLHHDLGKTAAAVSQLAPDAFLLCNRDDQEDGFWELLKNAPAEPCFIFIHDADRHCPFELAERFKRDTLPEWCKTDVPLRVETLQFPKRIKFESEEDEENAYTHLAAEYCKFSQENQPYNKATRRYAYIPLPNNYLAVAHHQIPLSFWHDRIENYFRYYLGEFSKILSETFCKRLLVICSLGYDEQSQVAMANVKRYEALFEKLKKDPAYAGRIRHYYNLGDITSDDIKSWYREEAKGESMDFRPFNLPDEVDFLTAIPIMKRIITAHNSTRNGG